MNSRKERAGHAVDLAATLLRAARAQETPEEKAQARRLARMMEDPRGKELTIALVDQAFRSRRPERIADQLAYLLERYGTPQFMQWWERVALMLGGVMGHYLPSVVVPPIVARLRHETESLILPGEEAELERYLAERRRASVRLNLNLLGEAILGEGEAARRLRKWTPTKDYSVQWQASKSAVIREEKVEAFPIEDEQFVFAKAAGQVLQLQLDKHVRGYNHAIILVQKL